MELLVLVLLLAVLGALTLLVLRGQSARAGEGGLDGRLQAFQQAMEAQLGNVNSRLNSVEQGIGQSLASTAGTLQNVGVQLGQLSESAKQMLEVGKNVSRLQDILRPPQIRGGMGELMLDRLLAQILPRENYQMQYRFRSGETVDAIIRLADGLVPVDSKFPLDNFARRLESEDGEEKKQSLRAFARDVKGHIDTIARKYILPGEGTFDFALMYIPAENVYYECIAKSEMISGDETICSYALARRVVPVSPSTFYGYLHALALGLRGLKVEDNARRIVDHLQQLDREFQRFRDEFDTLGGHITHAKGKHDQLVRQVDRIGTAISLPMEHTAPELPAGNGVSLGRTVVEEAGG